MRRRLSGFQTLETRVPPTSLMGILADIFGSEADSALDASPEDHASPTAEVAVDQSVQPQIPPTSNGDDLIADVLAVNGDQDEMISDATKAPQIVLAGKAVTVNVTESIDGLQATCDDGNVLEFSGRLHVLIAFNESASGNTVVRMHFQPQGATAVAIAGPDAGAEFTGTGATNITLVSSGNSFSTTVVNRTDFHGKAGVPNYLTHETIHMTVVDGVPTADIARIDVVCTDPAPA